MLDHLQSILVVQLGYENVSVFIQTDANKTGELFVPRTESSKAFDNLTSSDTKLDRRQVRSQFLSIPLNDL